MSKPYGILALFDTAPAIYQAAQTVRDAGYKRWDVITPFPVHGMDQAMGLKRSRVPAFTLVGGVTGFLLGNLIVWFMNDYQYPLIVGGKPYYNPVFPFPVSYELTILLAAFGTFFGMFITNFLPRHHHPVMNYQKFRLLTDDHFAVVIEAADPAFDVEGTRKFLEELGPKEVVMVAEDVGEEAVTAGS